MKVRCEYCGSDNLIEREGCRSCGGNLPNESQEVEQEPVYFDDIPEKTYWSDGGVLTGYPPDSPYSEWNLGDEDGYLGDEDGYVDKEFETAILDVRTKKSVAKSYINDPPWWLVFLSFIGWIVLLFLIFSSIF